jgi:hypothetical protein
MRRLQYRLERYLGLTLIALCGHATGFCGEDSQSDDVVRLKEFLVIESKIPSEHIHWHYATAPGFEVLSEVSDRETGYLLTAAVRARWIRPSLFPADWAADLSLPTSLLFYDQKPEDGDSSQALPSPVKTITASSSWGPKTHHTTTGLVKVADLDSSMVCGNLFDFKVHSFFYGDQDTRFRIMRRVPPLPAWLVQGLYGPCGLYRNGVGEALSSSQLIFDPKQKLDLKEAIPAALWISEAITKQIRDEKKAPADFIPIEEVLSMEASPAVPAQPSIWSAEAALFVRWGLFANTNGVPNRFGFLKYVDQSTQRTVTEADFRECFGIGFSEAERNLIAYRLRAVSEAIILGLPVIPPEAPVDFRAATDSEIARIRGDWIRLQGMRVKGEDPELAQECLALSGHILDQAYKNGARDPLFLASLGLQAVEAGRDADALTFLKAAADANVGRPRVYLELSRLLYLKAIKSPSGANGKLGNDQTQAALKALKAVRSLEPTMVGTYELLADVWTHSDRKPTGSDLAFLNEGIRLFPRDKELRAKIGSLEDAQ